MKIPNIFVSEKNFENSIKRLLNDKKPSVQPVYDKLEVIFANIYADGIAKLREQGGKPFTFYENVEARIADYGANCKYAKLFKTWLDSVTGIAYKARSTKFKLVLRSDRLENIAKDFDKNFILIDYNAEQGVELDSTKGKYGQDLTREETKNHEFWIAAMNGDREKLAKYVDFWFDKTGKEKGMGVYLRSNTSQDELRVLVLGDDYSNSDAYGSGSLSSNVRFLSGAQ